MVTKFLGNGALDTKLRSRNGGEAGATETGSRGGGALAAPLVPGSCAIPAAPLGLTASSKKSVRAVLTQGMVTQQSQHSPFSLTD